MPTMAFPGTKGEVPWPGRGQCFLYQFTRYLYLLVCVLLTEAGSTHRHPPTNTGKVQARRNGGHPGAAEWQHRNLSKLLFFFLMPA